MFLENLECIIKYLEMIFGETGYIILKSPNLIKSNGRNFSLVDMRSPQNCGGLLIFEHRPIEAVNT